MTDCGITTSTDFIIVHCAARQQVLQVDDRFTHVETRMIRQQLVRMHLSHRCRLLSHISISVWSFVVEQHGGLIPCNLHDLLRARVANHVDIAMTSARHHVMLHGCQREVMLLPAKVPPCRAAGLMVSTTRRELRLLRHLGHGAIAARAMAAAVQAHPPVMMKAVRTLRQLDVGASLAGIDMGAFGARMQDHRQVRVEGRLVRYNSVCSGATCCDSCSALGVLMMLHTAFKEEMLLACTALEAVVVGEIDSDLACMGV